MERGTWATAEVCAGYATGADTQMRCDDTPGHRNFSNPYYGDRATPAHTWSHAISKSR
jgi:hypothetical protein